MVVKWSVEALDDLRRIYIQKGLINRKTAQKTCALIFSDADILINHPKAGKKEPDLEKRKILYRCLVTKVRNYKLVYYIEDDLVHIIAVWDCRRDPQELKKELNNRNK